LTFFHLFAIIIIVKRGNTLKLIREPKAPKEKQKRRRRRIIQKIFSRKSKKPLDKPHRVCYNKDVPREKEQNKLGWRPSANKEGN